MNPVEKHISKILVISAVPSPLAGSWVAGREAALEQGSPGAGAQPGRHALEMPSTRAVLCVLPPQRPGCQLGWEFRCIVSISGMELACLFFSKELQKRGNSSQKMQSFRVPTFLWNGKEKCPVLFSDTRTSVPLLLPWYDPLHMPGTNHH